VVLGDSLLRKEKETQKIRVKALVFRANYKVKIEEK